MKLKNIRPWFLFMIMAAFAFGGIVCLFNINAYYWDSRGLNWVMLVSGIVCLLIAIYFLYLINKNAGSGIDNQ